MTRWVLSSGGQRTLAAVHDARAATARRWDCALSALCPRKPALPMTLDASLSPRNRIWLPCALACLACNPSFAITHIAACLLLDAKPQLPLFCRLVKPCEAIQSECIDL